MGVTRCHTLHCISAVQDAFFCVSPDGVYVRHCIAFLLYKTDSVGCHQVACTSYIVPHCCCTRRILLGVTKWHVCQTLYCISAVQDAFCWVSPGGVYVIHCTALLLYKTHSAGCYQVAWGVHCTLLGSRLFSPHSLSPLQYIIYIIYNEILYIIYTYVIYFFLID